MGQLVSILTPQQITDLFCKRLWEEGLERISSYDEFTNKNWYLLKDIEYEFYKNHNLSTLDLEIRAYLQKGIYKFLAV